VSAEETALQNSWGAWRSRGLVRNIWPGKGYIGWFLRNKPDVSIKLDHMLKGSAILSQIFCKFFSK
jgi:hypothetical protein